MLVLTHPGIGDDFFSLTQFFLKKVLQFIKIYV